MRIGDLSFSVLSLSHNSHQTRGCLLRVRPDDFALLFGLWQLFSGWPPFARFTLVALPLMCLFSCGEPGLLASVQPSVGSSAMLKEVAAELALASWQRASAAVCLWSHGSSSSSVFDLVQGARTLRFRGSSSCISVSVYEHISLWSDGTLSLSALLVDKLRGTRSSFLSLPRPCSDLVSGHGSEIDVEEYLLSSADLKERSQGKVLRDGVTSLQAIHCRLI